MSELSVPAPVDSAVPVPPDTADMTYAQMASEDWRGRLNAFLAQPAVRRALPALVGIGLLVVIGAVYLMIAQGPQRILYSSLTDGERAAVVDALERGGIAYDIDNATGAVTVSEGDIYRARMLVASDSGLAAPEDATAILDSIPLGSSRTLEGERLRLARERELMLTIREIDGIETVRVHLATPERSVFVRQSNPPSASVMVRLVSGRSLGQSQVEAIVNLVSASVPGMTADAVRVVDQNGRLLSAQREADLDHLVLQREFEAKLRQQVTELLSPLLGEGNFSSQVQVELDHTEVTSARESFDQDGAIRSESEQSSVRMAANSPGGVPGVTANTPPPDAALVDGPPDVGGDQGAQASLAPQDRETAMRRDYELGRELAVRSTRPGGLIKLSVAVAVDDNAMIAAAPLDAEQLQSLIGAAVGASEDRGDQVQVVVSAFESTELPPAEFYEQPWFATLVRSAAALLAVLLVLLMVVRPVMKAIAGPKPSDKEDGDQTPSSDADPAAESYTPPAAIAEARPDEFQEQMAIARQFASVQPERAVEALQRMLEGPSDADRKVPAR